ncbi:unnamed protein product [Durusdinium trenchii]|uniref:Sulfhydryl oxidase n=2 Tax=Durusdinium trenchii TaxID=1381693 RepID=A0ABP0S862_9DINO
MIRLAWAWPALPILLAADEELPQLPWSPEPPRYRVPVKSLLTKQTLSLYPSDSPVDVDVGDTFLQRLNAKEKGRSKWTILEIYDYTCPHCWYAVPVYTHVAEAYSGTPVQFTSINCHMRYSMEICFLLNSIAHIKDFPSFVACPPGVEVDAGAELQQLTQAAQRLASRLPAQNPTRKTLLKLARCRHKFIEDSVAGKEDPFLSAKQLANWVKRVTGHEATNWKDVRIGADFHRKRPVSAIAPPGQPGWLRDNKDGRPGVSRYIPGERWYDALMGFVALIYQGYQPSKHQATVEVTRYLSMAFPIKGKAIAELADQLERHGRQVLPDGAQKIIASWSIDVGLGDPDDDAGDESYEEHQHGLIHRTVGDPDGKTLQSLTCPTSSTCNLWNLLHVTLSAVAARGFSKRSLMSDGSVLSNGVRGGIALPLQSPEIGIREAQAFVRTFVDNFLTCKECRQRFLWDYDQCNYGRCRFQDWRDLPLWLWRVHNAVNLHVAGKHESSPDRRWPMYQDCPSCWREDLVMGTPRALSVSPVDVYKEEHRSESRWSTEELDMPFDTKAVFWHLISTFLGVRRIVFDVADFSGEEKEEVRHMLHLQGISLEPRVSGSITGAPQGPPEERLQTLDVSESAHSASQIFLALLAMATGVALVICYFGQDSEGNLEDGEMERDLGREARAPMFRQRSGDRSGGEHEMEEAKEIAKEPSPVQEPEAADAAE